MERLELKYSDTVKALQTLQAIGNEPFSIIVRDAAIQRFEYTFEAFWKFIKEYVKEEEGIIANSPKAVFKELFVLGFCSEEETVRLLEMTDKRNDTSHTYREAVAQAIYERTNEYANLMAQVLERIRKKCHDRRSLQILHGPSMGDFTSMVQMACDAIIKGYNLFKKKMER
jgi:nucleotidyltransferase substrate binding protein (TIGR01987 family)